MSSPRSRPALAEVGVVLLLGAAALLFAAPVFIDLGNWGILDWDQHLFHHAVPRSTILDYGEFPLWNPYNWSGVPLFANPESRVLAPTFGLTLLFGEVVGLKLEIFLSLAVGMWGAYWLLRELGGGRLGGLAAAFVFMFNSWYAVHVTVGHTWALNLAYLPWAFGCYRRALSDLRYALGAGAILALMVYGGGIYLVVMTGLLFAFYSAACAVFRLGGTGRHALVFAVTAGAALVLSAAKLLPMAELMLAHPRITSGDTGYTLSALGNALFDRNQTLAAAYATRPEEFLGWTHEGLYVGLLATLPFLLGVFRGPRERGPLLVVLVLFLWIALGSHVPLSLWSALHALPVLDNLRLTQRFGIVAVLVFAIFVGFGVEAVREFCARWTSRRVVGGLAAGALVAALAVDLFLVSSPLLREAFPVRPIPVKSNEEFRQILSLPGYDALGWRRDDSNPLYSTLSGVYPAFLANRGSTRGYEVVPVPSRAAYLRGDGYQGELYLAGAEGQVRFGAWSPNRMVIEVASESGGTVVVNQNHAPGWRVVRHGSDQAVAEPVSEHAGLLAIPVDGADRRLELVYRPQSFLVGVFVTAVGVVAWLGALWSLGRPRRESS